jgi:hypothetical protein
VSDLGFELGELVKNRLGFELGHSCLLEDSKRLRVPDFSVWSPANCLSRVILSLFNSELTATRFISSFWSVISSWRTNWFAMRTGQPVLIVLTAASVVGPKKGLDTSLRGAITPSSTFFGFRGVISPMMAGRSLEGHSTISSCSSFKMFKDRKSAAQELTDQDEVK